MMSFFKASQSSLQAYYDIFATDDEIGEQERGMTFNVLKNISGFTSRMLSLLHNYSPSFSFETYFRRCLLF